MTTIATLKRQLRPPDADRLPVCVRRFDSLDRLLPYVAAWDRLAAGAPFRGWTWLAHWWRHYGPQSPGESRRASLAVLGVFDRAGELLGLAPWYLERSPFSGRVLRALGSGEVCSEYPTLLCDPQAEATVVDALARYLSGARAANDERSLAWDLLELDAVDAADPRIVALTDRLAAAGCGVHRRPGMPCWRLDLHSDWNQYVASLGRSMRRDLRRLERNLCETGRAVLRSPSRADLARAMAIFVDLHQRRRIALGEPGCFASPRFSGFIHAVAPDLLERGQLDLSWLEVDGQAVAVQFDLIGDGVVYYYQTGVDPAALDCEPGKLSLAMTLRRAMQAGCHTFDFLRGNESYKARLGAEPRATLILRVVPRHALARLRHGAWLAREQAKEWLKRIRAPRDAKPASVAQSADEDTAS